MRTVTITTPPNVHSYWRRHKNIIRCENCGSCFKILFPTMYQMCPQCHAVMDEDENEFDECWGYMDREVVRANREFDKKQQLVKEVNADEDSN